MKAADDVEGWHGEDSATTPREMPKIFGRQRPAMKDAKIHHLLEAECFDDLIFRSRALLGIVSLRLQAYGHYLVILATDGHGDRADRTIGCGALPDEHRSHTTWRQVAVNGLTAIVVARHEHDAVARWIGLVVFDLAARDQDARADLNVSSLQWLVGPWVGDNGDIFVVVDIEGIRPIGVALAAARHSRIVGLHQRLIPLADLLAGGVPLAEIAGVRGRDHHQRQDEQENNNGPRPHAGLRISDAPGLDDERQQHERADQD